MPHQQPGNDVRVKPPGIPFDAYFMTSREAAAFLGLSLRTLVRLRSRGTGPPYYQFGDRLLRYRVRDLQAWALEQVQGTGARHRKGGA